MNAIHMKSKIKIGDLVEIIYRKRNDAYQMGIVKNIFTKPSGYKTFEIFENLTYDWIVLEEDLRLIQTIKKKFKK